jgi:hypothetical protein
LVETLLPEGAVVAEPVGEGREGVGVGAVVGFAAVAAMLDELSALEDREVFGDGGLGDSGEGGEGVDGLFAVKGEVFVEAAAGGVGEGTEEGIRAGRSHDTKNNYLVMGLSRLGGDSKGVAKVVFGEGSAVRRG